MRSDDFVSVVVITYNSEKYIQETLDSVYNQTFSNIELIITDDCSNDNTLTICRRWMGDHSDRFVRTKILYSDKNKGVVLNCNQGCKAAMGTWIKLLSGDDLLPPTSIENAINYIGKNNIETLLCVKAVDFYDNGKRYLAKNVRPDAYTENVFMQKPSVQRKKMLTEYVVLNTLGAMISKDLYETVDYYDVRLPEIEDFPFMLKLTERGIKIPYSPSIIGYFHRINIDSASQTSSGLMNKRAFDIDGLQVKQDKIFVLPNIPHSNIVFYYHYHLDLFRRYFIIHVLKNKNNLFSGAVNRLFLLFDPIFMKKKIFNVLKTDKSQDKKVIRDANNILRNIRSV